MCSGHSKGTLSKNRLTGRVNGDNDYVFFFFIFQSFNGVVFYIRNLVQFRLQEQVNGSSLFRCHNINQTTPSVQSTKYRYEIKSSTGSHTEPVRDDEDRQSYVRKVR